MSDKLNELEKLLLSKNDKKAKKVLTEFVINNDLSVVDLIFSKIKDDTMVDGMIISYSVEAYFRLKRKSLSDVSPMFDFDTLEYNINEALLDVLGYDKMIPSIEDQKKIIDKYFYFGEGIPSYATDPRYGLVAACAGWDEKITRKFLEYCLTINDAPLKYVTQNSLKRKYVKLR